VYYSNLSSGSINLAIANDKPVVAYPTNGFREIAASSDGAVVLTGTFAYYELARELQRIDVAKQVTLSKTYAQKAAWPKMAQELVAAYQSVMAK
jgi:glycosyltransferase involved in cell wall biosynthesis